MAKRTASVDHWFVFHRQNSTIDHGPAGLRIVIPYWVGWPPFSFLLLWTCFAAYGADENYSRTLRGTADSLVWSRAYLGVIFVIIGICAILWMALGREVVSFAAGSVKLWRGVLGIGRSWSFNFVDVRDVRVGSFLDPKAQGKWDASVVRAGIYFEYRGKLHSFGNELLESEAIKIVDAIRESHPHLVYTVIST